MQISVNESNFVRIRYAKITKCYRFFSTFVQNFYVCFVQKMASFKFFIQSPKNSSAMAFLMKLSVKIV